MNGIRIQGGRQRGAALVVVLMLLIVITLLGLASVRGTVMQERMAANTVSRGAAFQAAEAGLRQAESIVATDGGLDASFPSATQCTAGRCFLDMSVDDPVPAWSPPDFFTSGSGYQTGTSVDAGGVSIAPRFVIEKFGMSVNVNTQQQTDFGGQNMNFGIPQHVYRITSYAATPNGAEVIVQSIYRH